MCLFAPILQYEPYYRATRNKPATIEAITDIDQDGPKIDK